MEIYRRNRRDRDKLLNYFETFKYAFTNVRNFILKLSTKQNIMIVDVDDEYKVVALKYLA